MKLIHNLQIEEQGESADVQVALRTEQAHVDDGVGVGCVHRRFQARVGGLVLVHLADRVCKKVVC